MKQHLIHHLRFLSVFAIVCSSLLLVESVAKAEESLQLTLPKEVYAVPGIETGIYFKNTVHTEKISDYRFDINCKLGTSNKKRWAVTPTKNDVGQHSLTLTIKDAQGNIQGTQSTTLVVVPANAGLDRKIRLLMIGDSLTHASQYPNEVARLLLLPGNPEWEMLGTHRPGAAAPGVMHEGYGGWTWARFNSLYAVDANGNRVHCVDAKHQRSKSGSSPFVFPNAQGKPELNLPKYFEQYCNGNRPDFITIKLGINDCFSAPHHDPAALDARIDSMFKQADILIAALRKSAPYAEIGLCLTTPGNSRDEAFANYKGRYTRQGWNKIQHHLVQRQIKYFSAINDSKISIIPTELYLDITDGYPSNNAVHPNKEGYQQIGSTIYAWLKWRLASSK